MMYIYADNAATTKISPAAMAAMTKCMVEVPIHLERKRG